MSKKQTDINNNIQTQNNFCQKRKRKLLQTVMKMKEKKGFSFVKYEWLIKMSDLLI